MTLIHHTAICVQDLDESLRFWKDGLGFDVLIDEEFRGDWPTLLRADSANLHSIFLGESGNFESGIIELVDFGGATNPELPTSPPPAGFLLVSLLVPVESTLERLAGMGLGGSPRRVEVSGIAMAVVTDPNGVEVELIDTPATENIERLGVAGAGDRAPDAVTGSA